MFISDEKTSYGTVRVSVFDEEILVVFLEGPYKGQYALYGL